MSAGISSGVPRRVLLAGCVLAGALTGCTSGGGTEAGGRAAAVTSAGLRRRAARDSSALLAHYDETVSAHPGLAGSLGPLREIVAEHLAALNEPDGSAAATAGAAGTAPRVPGEPRRAVTALIDAERRAADRRLRALGDAPPELARLLASLAAASAASAHLLSEVRA